MKYLVIIIFVIMVIVMAFFKRLYFVLINHFIFHFFDIFIITYYNVYLTKCNIKNIDVSTLNEVFIINSTKTSITFTIVTDYIFKYFINHNDCIYIFCY